MCGYKFEHVLKESMNYSNLKGVGGGVGAHAGVSVRAFPWHVCVILFNYRSGSEVEANSAIITGNTSFNILWKSTPCVSFCVS